jgi:hypothetical protein
VGTSLIFGGNTLMRSPSNSNDNRVSISLNQTMRKLGVKMVDKLHRVQLQDDSSASIDERLFEINSAIVRFGVYMTKVADKEIEIESTRRSN